MGTGSWIFSILGTLIILALIVAATAWLLSARRDRGSTSTSGESATEILNRRLASGELTADQFRQLRETLSDTPSSRFALKSGRPADTHA